MEKPTSAYQFELGAKLSRQLHSALEGSLGPIITPSASCFGAFTMDAAEWGVDEEGRDAVASRMRDSTRFVLELLPSVRHHRGFPKSRRGAHEHEPGRAAHNFIGQFRPSDLPAVGRRRVELHGEKRWGHVKRSEGADAITLAH